MANKKKKNLLIKRKAQSINAQLLVFYSKRRQARKNKDIRLKSFYDGQIRELKAQLLAL
jgi:hypothetical protein